MKFWGYLAHPASCSIAAPEPVCIAMYIYPEADKPMAAHNRSTAGRSASNTVSTEVDQLRKKVKELALKLEREVKARKLDIRLAVEAKRTREHMTKEIKTLQEQARRLASQLKSTLSDADKREQVLKEARAKLTEFKLELRRKTVELRRKSGELKKLAEESAHRAAAIIRADLPDAAEPVGTEPAASPATAEPDSESARADKPTVT